MEQKLPLAKFEEVAADNGYEVFTPEEIAAYYKDNLQKSKAGDLSPAEKEIFTADITTLCKAVCVTEDGKEVVRYYRPAQVGWERTEDGTLLKGIEGVYLDTPTNRKLNRVGQAYQPTPDFMKSLLADEEGFSDILKAVRTGRYADTAENRRLHRVGQPYAKREGKGTEETDKEKKQIGDTKAEIDKIDAKYGKVYTALGKRKQEAYERGDKAEVKRVSDAIARMEKEHDAEIAKLKEKEGGEKGDEKLHAKADERKGGEKGDKKLHREAEYRDKVKKERAKREPAPGSKDNPLKISDIKDIHKDAAYQEITIDGHKAIIRNRGTYDDETKQPEYYVETGNQTHRYSGLDNLKNKISEFVRVANGGKADK